MCIRDSFIDASPYLRTYGQTPQELARTVILDVLRTTGITATAGIGTNPVSYTHLDVYKRQGQTTTTTTTEKKWEGTTTEDGTTTTVNGEEKTTDTTVVVPASVVVPSHSFSVVVVVVVWPGAVSYTHLRRSWTCTPA